MKKRKEEYTEIVKEAISYIKNVESLQELETQLGEELTDELLTQISKKLISMKKSNRALNRNYRNNGDEELALEVGIEFQELLKTDKKFRLMRNQSTSIEQKPATSKTSRISKLEMRRKKVISDIELINYWISEEAREDFNTYKSTEFYNERVSILRGLQKKYAKALQEQITYQKEMTEKIYHMVAVDSNIKLGLPTSKKLIYEQMNREDYLAFREKLEKITIELRKCHQFLESVIHLKELDNAQIKLLTNPEPTNEELIENYDFIEPKNEIEKNFQKILRKLVLGKYTSNYSNMPVRYIPEEIKRLLDNMLDLPTYELEDLTILAIDVLKQRRRGLKKEENRWEKAFLKNIEKEFERIKPIIYQIDEEDTSVYYDILNKLMQDDRNYDYIKKLLEIEEFTRARKTYKEREGRGRKTVIKRRKEHIVLLVLDNFIKNYKLKLLDQGLDYIEPIYYKEIIKLFINNNVELTQEEQDKYYIRIEEFKEYIKGKGYQTTEKVLNDIEEIENLDNIEERKENPGQLCFEKQETKENSEQLCLKKQKIKEKYEYLLNSAVERNRRKGYPEYQTSDTIKTFQIEGLEPFAFSLQFNLDGSKKIGVHTLDTTTIVNENDDFAKEVEAGFQVLLRLNTERVYPSMMFESNINKNNQLQDLKITPATIKIDKYYSYEDLDNYRNIIELKQIANWLRLIQETIEPLENENQQYTTKELISMYLSEKISSKLQSQKIPFVYQSPLPNIEQLILQNHNEICTDLHKIERQKAHRIFDVIDSKDSEYYTPTKTKDSRLEINPDTEAGIFLMNTIHKIVSRKYNPEEHQEEVKELIEKLNESHEYIPGGLEKGNEKEIKKMVKAYKKANAHA